MPSLADVLSKANVHELVKSFEDGVLELPETDAGDIGLTQYTFNQVGIPIIRYIHYRLMRDARTNPDKTMAEWPYRSTVSAAGILDEHGLEGPGEKGHPRLLSDVSRIMQRSGIALYKRPYWYLKPWDEDKVEYYAYGQTVKIDPATEKRIEEESGTPVNSRIDLRTIKVPEEADPESVMEFIERFVPAALRVQDKYQTVHDDLQKALERIADLEHELESQEEAQEWQGVGSRIKELMGKN